MNIICLSMFSVCTQLQLHKGNTGLLFFSNINFVDMFIVGEYIEGVGVFGRVGLVATRSKMMYHEQGTGC